METTRNERVQRVIESSAEQDITEYLRGGEAERKALAQLADGMEQLDGGALDFWGHDRAGQRWHVVLHPPLPALPDDRALQLLTRLFATQVELKDVPSIRFRIEPDAGLTLLDVNSALGHCDASAGPLNLDNLATSASELAAWLREHGARELAESE